MSDTAAGSTPAVPGFDVLGARKEGYSDGEIATFLAKQTGFDLNGARKEGYKDPEIVGFLAPTTLTKATGAGSNEPTGPTEYAPPAEPGGAPVAMGARPQATAASDDYAGTGAEGMKPGAESIGSALGRVGGAVDEGFRKGAATGTDIQGQPLLTGLMRQGGGVVGGVTKGLAQSAMETFGEKGGRDVLGWLAAAAGPEMMTAPTMGFSTAPETAVARAVQTPLEVARDLRSDRAATLAAPEPAITDFSALTNPLPTRGTPNQSRVEVPQSVIGANNLDGAIAAAQDVTGTGPYKPVTMGEVAARDGLTDPNEAYRRMAAENAAGGRDFGALRGEAAPEALQAPISPDDFSASPQIGQGGNGQVGGPPGAAIGDQPQNVDAGSPAGLTQPVPESVGSAASREGTPANQIAMDFDTMKANRRRAELDEIQAPATPGDNTIYVEGSNPTLAERTGDPTTSQVENMLRERRAGFFTGEGKPLTEANKARVRAIENEGIPDTTLKTMRDERAAEWDALSKDIIPRSNPADLSLYEEWLDNQLANPRIQENDPVFATLRNLKNRLYGSDGQLKSDPAAVWGMHDQLQYMLAKAKDPFDQVSAEAYSNKEILLAKKFVDEAMNVASDNQFQGALDAYAKRSQEIRAGEIMNELRSKDVNMHGELQPQRFHNDVLALAKSRGDKGIDPSMDLSDSTMRTLINIDTDLKRAGLIKMGAPRGSQTNLMGYLSDRLGRDAAVKILGTIPVVGRTAKGFFDIANEMHLDKLARQHTEPPPGGYTLHPSLGPETP